MYVPIKRWLTGDRAEMDEEEMMFDVAEEAHKEMCSPDSRNLSIPSPPIWVYGRKGKFTSRAASLIRFISVQ